MGLLELRSTDARFSNACIRAATPVLTELFGGGIGGCIGGCTAREPVVDEDGLRSASGFQGGRVCSLSCSGDSILGILNECDLNVSSPSNDTLAAVSLVSTLCTTSHFPPSLSSASLFAVFKELRLRPCATAPGPYTPCCSPPLRLATRPLPFSKFGVGASSIAPKRGGGGFGSRKSTPWLNPRSPRCSVLNIDEMTVTVLANPAPIRPPADKLRFTLVGPNVGLFGGEVLKVIIPRRGLCGGLFVSNMGFSS